MESPERVERSGEAMKDSPGMSERRPKTTRRVPLSRRQVLVGAGVAAGGLGVARLLGLHDLGQLGLPGQPSAPAIPAASGVAGTGVGWVTPLAKLEAQIAHLLRRATFGYSRTEFEQSVKDGFKMTVDRLVETKPAEPGPFPGGDDASRTKPLNIGSLQTRRIKWAQKTPTPYAQRMTVYWHRHLSRHVRKCS